MQVVNSRELDRMLAVPVPASQIRRAQFAGTAIAQMMDELASFKYDPLGFVRWAFPWGKPHEGLEDEEGPEQWQVDHLTSIGDKIRAGGDLGCVIREAVSAGHGVGKSAAVSWLILWAVSTYADTRGVITANTDGQLRTKTWAELSKWYQLFKAREFFTLTATALFIANDPVRAKGWRIDQIPWSKENSEAFAGLHNKGKRLLLIFDEAAGIDDVIFEKADGALTDEKTQIIWCVYGNPTRTTGRFHHACTHPKTRFTYRRVDARTVRFTNKAEINGWIEDYGEDSDYVRVKVKGQFPRAGFANFISPELVFQARRRRIEERSYQAYPKVMAVDPARFGDDFSVITIRQGLKVLSQIALSGFDGPALASRIVDLVRQQGPFSCIVYDAVGNGADLDSSLKRVPNLGVPLMPVTWGDPAKNDKEYFNQRSEAWGKMRTWLEHGQIPDDDLLADEITSLDFGNDNRFRIQLQSKKDCKKNGGKSPDRADSLALSMLPELIDRKLTNAKVRPVKRRLVIWSQVH
jgi:hypothetical protein